MSEEDNRDTVEAQEDEILHDTEDNQDNEDINMDDDSDDDIFCAWPDDETVRIIDMWRELEFLYNTSHKWYHRRDKKDAAMAHISKQLKLPGKYFKHEILIIKILHNSTRNS